MGSIGTVSLVDARAAALDARKLCACGIDPIEARRAARAAVEVAQAKARCRPVAARVRLGGMG